MVSRESKMEMGIELQFLKIKQVIWEEKLQGKGKKNVKSDIWVNCQLKGLRKQDGSLVQEDPLEKGMATHSSILD